jgi:L-malate glycosyltransferase
VLPRITVDDTRSDSSASAAPQVGRRRILFVSPTPEVTGPTTSLHLLLNRLRETHRVEVLLPEGDGDFRRILEEEGVQVWNYDWPRSRRWPTRLPGIVRLTRWLRRERFSLIYANEASSGTRQVCIPAILTGTPFVSHVRSMGSHKGRFRFGYLGHARAVIAVSEACAASYAHRVRPERLYVVHNGIVPPTLPSGREEARAELRAELGLPADTRLILHVGHLSPRKGQEHALQAVAQVLSHEPGVHLGLVGAHDRDPEYVNQIREQANCPPLAGKVSLLGFRSDVDRLLIGADILLHTALKDPHPRAVLEGMAAALPVVAFATDGVKETVVHGKTGYLVPREDTDGLASCLLDLVRDQRAAERMGGAGRTHVETEFSAVRTAERVGGILERVLSESTARV